MTKEERQRQIDSLLKSMREDLPPPKNLNDEKESKSRRPHKAVGSS